MIETSKVVDAYALLLYLTLQIATEACTLFRFGSITERVYDLISNIL